MSANICLDSLELSNEKAVREWFDRFEALCLLTKVAEEQKVSALVAYMGSNSYHILCELVAPKPPNQVSYNDIKTALLTYKTSDSLIAVGRYQFSKIQQGSTESVQNLFNRLNSAAIACKFSSKDERLRDQLVASLIHKDQIQVVLQIKNDDYVKMKAKDLCQKIQALETITTGMSQMVDHGKAEINMNKIKSSFPAKMIRNCRNCGQTHPINNCPAFGKKCAFCNLTGHFKFVCRKFQATKKQQFSSQFHRKFQGKYTRSKTKGNLNHNYLETQSTPPASILSIRNGSVSSGALIEEILINKIPVEMIVDTGAQVSVLKKDLANKLGLQGVKSQRSLFSYDGKKLNVDGKVGVSVTWCGQTKNMEIYIIDSASQFEGLLGQDILQAFDKKIFLNYTANDDGIKSIVVNIGLKNNAIPVFRKCRPIPLGLRPKVKEEIDRLVRLKFLEPVKYSEWGTPLVIVPKPNNKVRMCGDFKVTLNPAIAEVSTPLLNVEDLLSEIGGSQYFTKLDLEGAYLQLKIDEFSRPLTTINTPWGLYQYHRLPFGIKSAPSIFQNTMQKIMTGLPGVLIYLDDILIHGVTKEDHDSRLKAVEKRLHDYNIKLNNKKCIYNKTEINFLGHTLTGKGIQPNKELIQNLIDAPYPTDKNSLQSFIGSVQYYSKFIKNLASKMSPLTNLLKNNTPWKFTLKEQTAVDTLKNILTSNLVIKPFSLQKQSQLTCDASPTGIGGVLEQDGYPVIFISRKLTKPELNFSQTEREALSIVWCVKRLSKFLLGNKFKIITDHKALKFIFDLKHDCGSIQASRLHRWAITLSAYDYDIIHKPGKELVVADYLSRNSVKNDATDLIDTSVFFSSEVKPLSSSQYFKSILNTEPFITIKKYIKEGWPSSCSPDLMKWKALQNELTIHNECIYVGNKLFIPPEIVPLVLDKLHENHLGITATKNLARENYFWQHMSQSIKDKIQACSYCNEFKPKSNNQCEKSSWPSARKPWERIHVDYFQFGKTYFFVAVDAFSRFPEVFQCNDMTASSAKRILQSLFSRYGIAKSVVSDNGPAFKDQTFQNWLESISCKHILTAPYHPASNGMAERFVRTVKEQLKDVNSFEYMEQINKFLLCYRNLPHSTTGLTPAQLMFNRKLRTTHSILSSPQPVWIKDALKKKYEKAMVVGELGKVMKIVKRSDGTITRRHDEQIKFNPHFSNIELPEYKEDIKRYPERLRRPPDRYHPI